MLHHTGFRPAMLAAAISLSSLFGFGLRSTAAHAVTSDARLYDFEDDSSDGAYPYSGLIEAPDGSFYGTSTEGGTTEGGTVYKIDPKGNFSVVHNFDDADGYQPESGVVLGADGSLYGTTAFGGSSASDGVVYKITASGAYSVLHAFTGGTDGGFPSSDITIGSDGKLYGATTGDEGENGSTSADWGTLFSMNTDGSNYVVQYRFGDANGPTVGEQPSYALLPVPGSASVFYGAAYAGGSANHGTVFSFSPGSTDGGGAVQVLHTFGDGSVANDGAVPGLGHLQLDSGGNLYGTTEYGGLYGDGTVFKLNSGRAETLLHSFNSSNPGEGETPNGGVLLATDGNLYGTTINGGSYGQSPGDGTLYSVSPTGSGFTTLYQFEGSSDENGVGIGDGSEPFAAPIEDTNGNLIGATQEGGDFNDTSLGYGTIYEYPASLPNQVKLSGVAIAPSSVAGGSANATGTVTLAMPAPSGGAVVSLQSSQPGAAAVPSSVTIASGGASAQFPVTTSAVTSSASVTITAFYNNSTASVALTVTPATSGAALKSVALSPASTQGGSAATTANRVSLSANAAATTTVTLTSSNTAVATVPATVTIQPGYSSHVFTITTKAVTSAQTVTVTAKCNGVTQTATLTVTPPPIALKSVALSPASTKGGSAATTANRVSLTANAAAATTVTLTSSNTAVATMPPTVTIQSGYSSHVFTITTKAVTSAKTVTITATSGGISQTATLTVTP